MASDTAKTAKRHWKNRFESEQHMSLRQWCREIHSNCDACQAFLGKTYNPKTGQYEKEAV